jgi:hypothetical protein
MLDRFKIPLAAAAFLSGCGLEPQTGGGTELPGPSIQIFVMVDGLGDPSTNPGPTRVAARQWRLWGVQSQTADSTNLESRGLLSDSSGIVTLPPDSGTYLVEAWTKSVPPDSLDLRLKLANSDLPSSPNCLNVIVPGSTPTSIKGCTQNLSTSPSAVSHLGTANLPDVLTMVRIPGVPSHQFRIIGRTGDTLPMGEVRLWKWNGSFTFRGILKQTGNVTAELPTLAANESFVVEAWRKAGVGPTRIATTAQMDTSQASPLGACKTPYTDPLPSVLTLHECPLAISNPSGGNVLPDYSAVMEYVPKN